MRISAWRLCGTRVEVSAEDYLVIAAITALARQHRRVPGDGGRGRRGHLPAVNPSSGCRTFDTAMTLFARTLLDDVFHFVSHLAEGKHRRHYKDRDGEPIKLDHYLHRQLTKKHEETSDIYGRTSGFIRFSQRHMERVLDLEATQRTGRPVFKDVEHLTAGWDDEEVCTLGELSVGDRSHSRGMRGLAGIAPC